MTSAEMGPGTTFRAADMTRCQIKSVCAGETAEERQPRGSRGDAAERPPRGSPGAAEEQPRRTEMRRPPLLPTLWGAWRRPLLAQLRPLCVFALCQVGHGPQSAVGVVFDGRPPSSSPRSRTRLRRDLSSGVTRRPPRARRGCGLVEIARDRCGCAP